MICVSLREPDYQHFLDGLRGLEMAEIRLDGARLSGEEIKLLFSRPVSLVATFRPEGVSEATRIEMLSLAIRAGARFVDLELESSAGFRKELAKVARANGCRVIISYHNEKETPSRALLDRIVERCFSAGADIAKLACRVRTAGDCARILGLYDQPRPIIAIGMGELGTITRVVALLLGAPFTYASLTSQSRTADGQLDWKTMQEKIKALRG